MAANEELSKRVYVSELKNYFNFKQVSGNADSLTRWIIAPDINRPGLELTGYLESEDLKRVVIIGNKETHYLSTLDFETQKQRFAIITDSYTPCIIMTGGNKAPEALLSVAREKNFPVFESEWKSYMAVQNIVGYLSVKLAPETNMHAVMLEIYGVGVMITGESAIGKSELALELIKRGHGFLADDQVNIARVQNNLVCSAPELLKGMLEIRGIGIIDVGMMFGASAVIDSQDLQLVINLVNYDQNETYNRLDYEENEIDILDLKRPYITIPVTPGRALSVLVEAAVTNFRLNQKGFNSTEKFKKKVWDSIQSKNHGGK